MRFLIDQDVYAATIRLLTDLGHDVVPIAAIGISRSSDTDVLATAHSHDRILVTRDRDYGGLVFVQGSSAGVVFLRMVPTTINQVHAELTRVLSLYDEQFLRTAFIVVEPARHRVRKISTRPQSGP